jgi:hypothetical protein
LKTKLVGRSGACAAHFMIFMAFMVKKSPTTRSAGGLI